MKKAFGKLNDIAAFLLLKLLKKKSMFILNGKHYQYFYHWYNRTWYNERAVEIPIVWDIVKNCNGDILEIGNVLSHYFKVDHDIVDKFEHGKNVVNADVIDFIPSKKYDMVVSISTLEHIGFDEDRYSYDWEGDPNKFLKALDKMKECCKDSGKIIFTYPVCFNRFIDDAVKNKKIPFKEIFFMVKTSDFNWIETDHIPDNRYVDAVAIIIK